MIRDINAGRFAKNTSLVLVTHGLAARVFLMRWFHWTVDQVGFDQGLLHRAIFPLHCRACTAPVMGQTSVSTIAVAHHYQNDR